jgi:competence protein ComEC
MKNNRHLFIIFSCILIVTLLASIDHAVSDQVFSIQISFIDVGQGDSALIQTSDGYNILIDGGVVAEGQTVLNYLRNNGVTNLSAIVASHADSDHIGGLITVLNATDITIESVIYNGYPGDTQTWVNFVSAVTNEGLSLTTAQYQGEFHWGITTAYILNPPAGLANPETNDASVVMLVDYDNIETLFTGDIDSTIESEVISRGSVAADILKVAHHGSNYSSSTAFLDAVHPANSVISVGPNSYGHPGADTLARLSGSGTIIWRTDINGTIVVTSSDGNSYQVIPAISGAFFFLPMVQNNISLSPNPTPTPTPPATPDIVITNIFYDGAGQAEPDEYVEIKNNGGSPQQLEDWTLRDTANHVFTFPNYSIHPGEVCRVYTNEYHPEWCGFDYASGSAIWNNGGDCAYLQDIEGFLIFDYCY